MFIMVHQNLRCGCEEILSSYAFLWCFDLFCSKIQCCNGSRTAAVSCF